MIDGLELFKFFILCLGAKSAEPLLRNLPLFLCSIQLIAIPLAAFSKGRVKETALDFVCIFGILGAVFGTIGAGQNYNAFPVLSFDNVISGLTHTISGFASLYIIFAKMATIRRDNMFLMSGDGTPYDILYNLVNGNRVLYPMLVVALFLIYISLFYCLVHLIRSKKEAKQTSVNAV